MKRKNEGGKNKMRNTKESKIKDIKTIANSKKVFCEEKPFVSNNNLQNRNYSNSTRCYNHILL